MTRGNQRELAREKAAKKKGATKAGETDSNKGNPSPHTQPTLTHPPRLRQAA